MENEPPSMGRALLRPPIFYVRRPENYILEVSRLSALLWAEIRQLIGNVGAGMPLKYPGPAILKLELLDADGGDTLEERPEDVEVVRRPQLKAIEGGVLMEGVKVGTAERVITPPLGGKSALRDFPGIT